MSSLRLEECGRVLISMDRTFVALDCFCCKELFTQWEKFIEHIHSQHRRFELEYSNYEEDDETAAQEEDSKQDIPELVETTPHKDVNVETSTDSHCDVPLKYEDEVEYLEEYIDHYKNNYPDEESIESSTNLGSYPWEVAIEILSTKNEFSGNDSVTTSNLETSETSPTTLSMLFAPTAHVMLKQFINNLQNYPCLWQKQSSEYTNQTARQKALLAISKILNTNTKSALNCINELLNWYQQEYQRRNHTKDTTFKKMTYTGKRSPKDDVKHEQYKLCDFLEDSSLAHSTVVKNLFSSTIELQCRYCAKIFSKRKYLGVHESRHLKDFQYKCDYCDKSTATSSEMTTHMRVHTGEKPYVCSICGKAFKTSSVLCQHQRKHEEPTLQCSLCPKAYHDNYQLKNHMNTHLNKRDHKCEFCGKTFTSAKMLYAHKLNLHSELRKTFCKYCKRCFPHIAYHLKVVHGIMAK